MGCQSPPPRHQLAVPGDAAPGSIVVEVSTPKYSRDQYSRYRIVPSQGLVEQIEEGPDVDPYRLPHIDCLKGVEASSPDNRFAARCHERSFESDEFTVIEKDSGK